MRELKLTARIWERNTTHAKVQVFQNGGLAGELTVDAEQAKRVVAAIGSATTLLEQRDRLAAALRDLHDEQIGPPLVSRAESHQAAMAESEAILAEVEKS